ncbi:MAG: 5-bromo-4-chloroindolyl phosphate hydrolysis family protein [Oscillospiraceae bacterium]|nr:5-bromo-4-chloroindolyl phosphate hydrolysis family protein [Oscillospiraceae bacterium]
MRRYDPNKIFSPRPLRRFLNHLLIWGLGFFSLILFSAFCELAEDALFYLSLFPFSQVGPIISAVLCGASLAGCVWGFFNRIRDNRMLKQMEQLAFYIARRQGECSFEQLSTLWKIRPEAVASQLYKLDKKGLLKNFVVDIENQKLYLAEAAPEKEPEPQPLNEAEQEAAPVIARLNALSARLPSAEDAALMQRFTDDIEAILADTRKDPRDISAATQFLHRFLPMGEKLFSRLPDISSDHATLRGQITGALNTLHTAFETKLSQLHENDRMEAEAEAAVLEQLLRGSGLVGPEENQLFPPL